jgi:hypothetical protein
MHPVDPECHHAKAKNFKFLKDEWMALLSLDASVPAWRLGRARASPFATHNSPWMAAS